MKYFITGGSGQFGYDLINELNKEKDAEIYAPTSTELDITNREKVISSIQNFKPDVVFHCAAYTDVEKAELEENQKECYNINVNGTKNIVDASWKVNAKLIYISTDCVFDGEKETPYTIDDKTNPINYYGATKQTGERYCKIAPKNFIVRVSWLFGKNGDNFIKRILDLSHQKDELKIINDQIGSPTYTLDLAKALIQLAKTENYGIYHITNRDTCSLYDLAQYICELDGTKINLIPVSSDDYKTKAKKPKNSILLNNIPTQLPIWKNAVERYYKEIKGE